MNYGRGSFSFLTLVNVKLGYIRVIGEGTIDLKNHWAMAPCIGWPKGKNSHYFQFISKQGSWVHCSKDISWEGT